MFDEFVADLAVVIGIGAYSPTVGILETPVLDAEAIASCLESRFGYEVILRRDSEATLTGLRTLLRDELPKHVPPGSRLLFYFAGHGVAFDSTELEGPQGQLVLHQNVDPEGDTHLPMRELYEALAALPCRHLLVVLDCCFAGSFRWASRRPMYIPDEVLYEERYRHWVRNPARWALASAAHDEFAVDRDRSGLGKSHSPFAAALLDGLAGEADTRPDGGDGIVTLAMLYAYVQGRVVPLQSPILSPLPGQVRGEFVFRDLHRQRPLVSAEQAVHLDESQNPYRDQKSYGANDTELFFGREEATRLLLHSVRRNRLNFVVGPSGSGKSSLVEAGLVPRLQARRRPDVGWWIATMLSGSQDPFAALRSALAAGGDPAPPSTEMLRGDPEAVRNWVIEWKTSHPYERLLVIFDQAEDLITRVPRNGTEKPGDLPATSAAFLSCIALMLEAGAGRFRALIVVRADFTADLEGPLASHCKATSSFVVQPLSRDALRQVIEGPFGHKALYFDDPRLVDRLADEMLGMPGALPLLSRLLNRLYLAYLHNGRGDRLLAVSDLEQIADTPGPRSDSPVVEAILKVLRLEAERVVDRLPKGDHQETLWRILLRLVDRVGDRPIRRRQVSLRELDFPEDSENLRVSQVLEQLIDGSHLVVRDQDQAARDTVVELAHDKLLEAWPGLGRKVEDARKLLPSHRQLTRAAIAWGTGIDNARGEPRRRRNLDLRLLKVIQTSGLPEKWLNRDETEYLAAARIERRRRNVQLGAVGLVAAFVLGWALFQWIDSASEARASGLALFSRQSSERDANRQLDGLFYAASSLAEKPSPLGYTTLIQAAQALPKHVQSIDHDRGGQAVDLVRFIAHDRLILSAGYTSHLQFADAKSGLVVGRVHLSSRPAALAQHPNRPLLAVATQRGLDLVAFTPESPSPAPHIIGHAPHDTRVQAVVLEPDGQSVIAGDFDGNLSRYRLDDAAGTWQAVKTIRLEDDQGAKVAINGLVLDPAARRLAVADIQGTIYCLNLDHWNEKPLVLSTSSEIFGMVLHPDGHLAAAAQADGGYFLFRPADCTLVEQAPPPATQETVARGFDGKLRAAPRFERAHTGIAFSHDGSFLGIASHDRTVRIYTVDRPVLTHVIVHPAMTRTLAFSANGSRVATGADDGRIEIWDVGATVETWRVAGVEAFAPDPKGRWVATWADDGVVRIVDAATGQVTAEDRLEAEKDFRRNAKSLVTTPDGSYLAAQALTSTQILTWNLSALRSGTLGSAWPLQHPNLTGNVSTVGSVASGPGLSQLVTGERYQGRAVRLWDLARRTQPNPPVLLKEEITGVATGAGIYAAADASGLVRIVAADTGEKVAELRLPAPARGLAISPDGKSLLAGYVGKDRRGTCLCALEPEKAGVLSWLKPTAQSPRERQDACSARGLVCRTILPDLAPTRAVFSAHGHNLAIAVDDSVLDSGSLFLLANDGRGQAALLSSVASFSSLEFSADGALLAAGGRSRSLEIYDVQRGEKIAEIPLPNPLREVRFLAGSGRQLLTLDGYDVGFLRLWSWSRDDLIAAACARLPESYHPEQNPILRMPLSLGELCGTPEELAAPRKENAGSSASPD